MANKRVGKMPKKHVSSVISRSKRVCEGCGATWGREIHHRRFLSRGGEHNLANLMLLCGNGNQNGCHGLAHSGDAPPGWAISKYESQPEDQILFQDTRGFWWRLFDDGKKALVENRR